MSVEIELLGVRHHGPGSARAVAAALARLRPDAVLIEGPPEADAIAALAADKTMVPPVALLAHAVEDPARAAFWPFAEFSPEWVALRYAVDRDLPVRFIDLPAAYGLAEGAPQHESGASDPIGELARAAGYEDSERWWEDTVEHRGEAETFAAVAEAMTALREQAPTGTRDELREAYMRQQLRAARRAGHQRIAVVCGAWHVPALATLPTVAQDKAVLAGLPKKTKVEITWVPWTHRRLSQHTGYGAGIDSPGWYHHLFTAPEADPLPRWITRAAELLRAEDHPVSSAHVIEAVRLAATLAVMRGRPLAGLTETLDAIRAVLCDGSDVALGLVRERLVVGDALGEVPEATPTVPLQRDLARVQRALRLKPEAEQRVLDLDLRKELDAGRSLLLHRLRLLGLDWGTPAHSSSTGTFRESWRLCWEPEYAVRVVEAAQWGTTVEEAAAAKAVETALTADGLPALTALAERCLLAGLPGALPVVLRVLADRAALDTDVAELAAALPALVRALRYGDVRGTDAGALDGVARALADRICIGLPAAGTGLDAAGAEAMRQHLDAVHGAVALLRGDSAEAGDDLGERWAATLHSLVRREPGGGAATGVPGLLRGRAVRLLLDDGRLDSAEAGRRMGLVLSVATAPGDAAGWVEGFLSGGGALLLHDPLLLGLLDEWLCGVSEEVFVDVLPLLRRTFSTLETGVRRTIGERVAAGPLDAPGPSAVVVELDEVRADAVMPVLAHLLGTAHH
ncbi:hypothetical protein CFP65_2873 [Kitasatospora sp. MMS16-BH015]|uniref:DUF5682 family protein n=1 Tax=Kitasatospora sp. MMS16-BH015 TaxID=2018025 RepID=UPI000CA1C976|nr:DUF5682 family protein [Kitasatospora sp. MMS16-BH015]AUG77688.1 hypothetical protein CFP65_2873 [Kitasatospora sp. MMS16-BH015]